jgi:hypothetical protein
MRTTPVYRSIERPSRIFGLELFDFFIWVSSFTFWNAGRLYALGASAALWAGLFMLRYRRPSGFLLTLARYWTIRFLYEGRFSAARREPPHAPWLAIVSNRTRRSSTC